MKDHINHLVDEILLGKTEARQEFIRVVTPYLSRLSVKLGVKSQEIQSSIDWVLTKVLSNMGGLDKDKNILSFLSYSVRNFCVDEYRKVRVRKRRERELKDTTPVGYRTSNYDLGLLIDDLTSDETEKKIITKIVLDKSSPKELSEEFKVPVKQVKALLNRVKEKLTA